MAIYRVYECPADSLDAAIFVREGFSFAAAVFTFIWAVWHRMWLVAVALLAALTVVGIAADVYDVGRAIIVTAQLAIAVTTGFVADAIRGRSLVSHGFVESGIVEAANRHEAELKYFVKAVRTKPRPPINAQRHCADGSDTLGIFGTV